MSEWRRARKRPIGVEYREVETPWEIIETLEGHLLAVAGEDYIIKGVDGELYPIKKDIFYKTYEVMR